MGKSVRRQASQPWGKAVLMKERKEKETSPEEQKKELNEKLIRRRLKKAGIIK